MKRRKPKAKSTKKTKSAKKPSTKRDMKAATEKLKHELQTMQAKLREMMIADGINPDELAVQSAKDFAQQMEEINRGFREALKKAMMADGKIKPGQVLTIRGRRVFLKPRPGCPESSMDPNHYDLAYEHVH